VNYQYAYLLGNLFLLLPLWLLILYFRRDLRKKLISTSLFGLLITPFFVNWYIKDYWQPETIFGQKISIEDCLFGFLISGIFASLYLTIFNKHHSKKRSAFRPWIIIIFLLLTAAFYYLSTLSSINSIYLTSVLFIIFSIVIIYFRYDLKRNILTSGFVAAILHLCGYLIFIQFFPEIFNKWWFLDNLSNLRILSIPIEEFIWAFGWGMATSSLYEFYTGYQIE
jgi:hypothetical protein